MCNIALFIRRVITPPISITMVILIMEGNKLEELRTPVDKLWILSTMIM